VPSNRWNLIVYRAWAAVYDRLLERLFRPGRESAARALALRPGERVLLIGVGTGQDLPLLPAGVEATGIDLSRPMLDRARQRLRSVPATAELLVGDAAALDVPTGSFDAAILNLVLSVVPDPVAALGEAMRALRPGGRAVVFDKFAPDGRFPSPVRRAVNAVTTVFGTQIDRRLSDIIAGSPCRVVSSEPSILGGQYRVVLLIRTDEP
jgi:ubiquinone/menaquinone biosynthesis C-methylase UbiE